MIPSGSPYQLSAGPPLPATSCTSRRLMYSSLDISGGQLNEATWTGGLITVVHPWGPTCCTTCSDDSLVLLHLDGSFWTDGDAELHFTPSDRNPITHR